MSAESKVPAIRFEGFSGEWLQKELSEITIKIGSGKTPKGGSSTYVSEGIPLLRSQNIYSNLVNLNDVAYITAKTHEEMESSRVLTNDVLLNITGASIGRSAVYTLLTEANVNQHVCIIRLIGGYSSKFAQLLLASSIGQKQIDNNQAGGAREGLNFQHIGRMNFVFTSIEEQTKIGNYFQQLDTLIAQHQQKHDKLLNIKKALLEKCFPQQGSTEPPIRFKGFSGEWEEVDLGKIADVTKLAGYEFTKHIVYTESGTLIALRGLNIKNGSLNLKEVKYIDKSDLSMLSRSKLYKNDLLFTYVGTIGEVAIVTVNDKYYLAPNVSRIRLNRNIDPKFIAQTLGSSQYFDRTIFPLIATSSQPALSMENIRKFKVCFPCEIEQTKIGQLFQQLDTLISQHQAQLKKLGNIKQACLEKMFV